MMTKVNGQIDFEEALTSLRDTGYNPIPNMVQVSIPNAKVSLERGIRYYMGNKSVWIPAYDEIVSWMTDNKGRGLLCYGNCGLGKSLICWKILPVLINHFMGKIVTCYEAQTINNSIDEVKRHHLIYIDDIGTENLSVKWGERRLAFPEIVDEAEKRGHLLMVTTNLTLNEIAEKYGDRTMDRLVGLTKRVKFVGESLRK